MSGSTGEECWSHITQVQSTSFGMKNNLKQVSGISPELKKCESTIRLSLFSVVIYQNKNCKYIFHFKHSQLRLQSVPSFFPIIMRIAHLWKLGAKKELFVSGQIPYITGHYISMIYLSQI